MNLYETQNKVLAVIEHPSNTHHHLEAIWKYATRWIDILIRTEYDGDDDTIIMCIQEVLDSLRKLRSHVK